MICADYSSHILFHIKFNDSIHIESIILQTVLIEESHKRAPCSLKTGKKIALL